MVIAIVIIILVFAYIPVYLLSKPNLRKWKQMLLQCIILTLTTGLAIVCTPIGDYLVKQTSSDFVTIEHSREISRLLASGITALHDRDYQSAEQLFKQAISLDSGNYDALTKLAETYKQLNFDNLALEQYDTLIDFYPEIADTYYQKFLIQQYTDNNLSDILDLINIAIELEPTNYTYISARAHFYRSNHSYELAIKEWEGLISSVKDNKLIAEYYVDIAICYVSMKNYEEAELNYNLAVKKDETALDDRAGFYIEQANYSKALIDYNRLIDICPTEYNYLRRAECYAAMDERALAIKDFEQIANISTDSYWLWQMYNSKAEFHAKLAEYENAIQDYTNAISYRPWADTYLSRADIYKQLKDYKDAIDDITKAIEYAKIRNTYTTLDFLYFKRGEVYYLVENYDNAISDYNSALQINLDNYSATISLGYAFYHKEDYQNAYTAFQDAYNLAPENFYANVWYGKLSGLMGNTEEALKYINKAININPDHYFGYLCRGQIFENLSDYNSAFLDYKRAVEIFPNDQECKDAFVNVGKILIANSANDESYYLEAIKPYL